jgi:hypothetical protein
VIELPVADADHTDLAETIQKVCRCSRVAI